MRLQWAHNASAWRCHTWQHRRRSAARGLRTRRQHCTTLHGSNLLLVLQCDAATSALCSTSPAQAVIISEVCIPVIGGSSSRVVNAGL